MIRVRPCTPVPEALVSENPDTRSTGPGELRIYKKNYFKLFSTYMIHIIIHLLLEIPKSGTFLQVN